MLMSNYHRRLISFLILITLIPLAAVWAESLQKSIAVDNSVSVNQPVYRQSEIPDIVFIPQNKGWLIPLILPYMHRATHPLPTVLVLPEKREFGIEQFLLQITDEKILSLAEKTIVDQHAPKPLDHIRYLEIPHNPSAASLTLARHFLVTTPGIIITPHTDATQLIKTATFAGLHRIPLIIADLTIDTTNPRDLIREMKTTVTYQVSESGRSDEGSDLTQTVVKIGLDDLDGRIIHRIGRDNVNNIIVVNPNPREQIDQKPDSNAAYIVPYIAIYRNSPVLLTDSSNGTETEESIFDFIETFEIFPNNITIVGDYEMTTVVNADERLQKRVFDKKIQLEPTSTPPEKNALAFGVGRIPFCRLSCLSIYYARLKKRANELKTRQPRYTIIANLQSGEHEPLYLLEAISRATAAELQNRHLKGHEFYGASSSESDIWEKAANSDLVIYEGHIEEFPFVTHGKAASSGDQVELSIFFKNYPFVVLQSCNSLKNPVELLEKGAIGIIGSCTKIHSVSGSAIVKAFFDQALYHSSNAGEALRESKNFFLSLVGLKESLGHHEQDKTLRTALSYRLMGDPEVRLFQKKLPTPLTPPVTGRFISPREVEIRTPSSKLSPIIVDRFYLSHAPNMKPVGFIRTIDVDGRKYSQVRGFHFFRLPINQNLDPSNFQPPFAGLSQTQSTALIDPYRRWIYFLHYPQNQQPNQSLRFKLE